MSTLVESDEVDLCQFPPDVTQSNSTETSTTIHEDHHHNNTNSPNSPKQRYVTVRVPQAPHTPEGLRPRPTVQDLRQQLGINNDSSVEEQQPPAAPKPRNFLVEKKVDASRMLPAAPSRSWSMPSQPSLPANHNGFYNNHIEPHSPHLQLGQARTAVGSFVAFCEQQQATTSARPNAMMTNNEGYDADADGSQCQNDKFAIFSSQRTGPVMEEEWDEKKEEFSTEDRNAPVYFPLDHDPIYLSRTPQRGPAKRYVPLSPFSANISLDASPSSLAKPYSRSKPAHPDTSFSSGAALLAHAGDCNRYDFGRFGPEEAQEIHVKIASDQTHVSGMTQSIGLDNDAMMMTADMPEAEQEEEEVSDEATSIGWGDDESLRQQKVQNQRRLREELLVAIVERLQDNIELIAEIYKADPAALQTNWFVETPTDKEGLLTGFSTQKRMLLVHHLSSMLDEMNVAQPEDFFLSPSQIPQYTQPHDELQMALSFCRTLVQMAVPVEDDANPEGRWSVLQGLRPAMGIVPIESPPSRPRGGDTSVFTLPSASAGTPMTSNVSFSTTIASSQQTSRVPHFRVDGLKVRHTIEIVSTLLQKLSLCCDALVNMKGLSTEKTVRITKEIKRNYLQLISVDHCMLRALVDSFELEVLLPPTLSQIVSADDDDEGNQFYHAQQSQAQAVVLPPPRVIRSGFPKTSAPSYSSSQRSDVSSSHDLFSPQTLDMMSDRQVPATVPEEYDDLRRQVGSVDYDDYDEYREGSDTCQRE